MSKISGAVESNIFIVSLLILVLLLYLFSQKRRKIKLAKEFKEFRAACDYPLREMRTIPRITVPDPLEIVVTFPDGLRAYVSYLSLSSLDIRPAFSLKKPLINSLYTNVKVHTPINQFLIKEAKIIRCKRREEKNQVALRIVKIEEEQFHELKNFMTYLDKFEKK